MLLPTKPRTTRATPNRCGKSLRANRSRMGHTRQRLICWPSMAPAGIATCWWQWGHSRACESASRAFRAARPQPGQLYVRFIGEEESRSLLPEGTFADAGGENVVKVPLGSRDLLIIGDTRSP